MGSNKTFRAISGQTLASVCPKNAFEGFFESELLFVSVEDSESEAQSPAAGRREGARDLLMGWIIQGGAYCWTDMS
jgi:hypothetical protein